MDKLIVQEIMAIRHGQTKFQHYKVALAHLQTTINHAQSGSIIKVLVAVLNQQLHHFCFYLTIKRYLLALHKMV